MSFEAFIRDNQTSVALLGFFAVVYGNISYILKHTNFKRVPGTPIVSAAKDSNPTMTNQAKFEYTSTSVKSSICSAPSKSQIHDESLCGKLLEG